MFAKLAKRLAPIAIFAVVALYVSGSGLPGQIADRVQAEISSRTGADDSAAAPAKELTPADRKAARAQLAEIETAPAGSMSGYDREAFRHWSDPDGNGCDAREDALARDRAAGRVSNCQVSGGRWIDPYGGETFTASRSLDIDHIVPLGNAWRSGATKWDAATRERFANDPANLLAVSATLNRQKGDAGPEEWLPPRAAERGPYAVAWIAMKARYDLTVTPAERTTLTSLIG